VLCCDVVTWRRLHTPAAAAASAAVCSPLAALLNLIIPTWPLAKTPKNTMFPDLQADFDSDLW
jgi:hypothetical protein